MSLRKLHKYISLLVSLQLLLWTISGIYFSFNKIENVRGEQYYKTEEVEAATTPINIKKVSKAFAFNVDSGDKLFITIKPKGDFKEDIWGFNHGGTDMAGQFPTD